MNGNADEALSWWDWKTDAQLSAHQLDQYPHWDNFDRAVNTMVNGMVAACDVLITTMEMTQEERTKVAAYYWAQIERVSREMQAHRGMTNTSEAGEDGATHPDTPSA